MTLIDTSYGTVAGAEQNGVHIFKNIPFAAAPSGEKRWHAPSAPTPWTGVREANEFGAISWQVITPAQGPLSFTSEPVQPQLEEDCLSLNVWTPGVDGKARPVMVWIHGGGFVSGSGSAPIYEGLYLAAHGDVVVVTINYRLGALGFLNLHEITGGRIRSTGNEGLLDQAFALEWVRDNIHVFGGDANNVTIFGESAGGMSVGALLALSEAKGLFHKAIPQSGAAHTANTLVQSTEVASRLLAALEISPNSDLQKLYAVPPEKLTQVAAEVSAKLGRMSYQPCIDGAQIPLRPIDCVANGAADGVKVLVGSTKDEFRLFTAMDPSSQALSEEGLQQRLAAQNGRRDLTAVANGYREMLNANGGDVTPADVWSAMETDRAFRMPGVVLAETMNAREQAAYQYMFTVESPALGGALKSCHAIDIGYVFGTQDLNDGTRGFFGGGPEHRTLSEVVMDAWLAFAHTGNPRTESLSSWAAYDKSTRSTAIFGCPASVENAPFEELRALWDDESVQSALGSL